MILAVLDDSPAALDMLAFTQSLGRQVEVATFAAFDTGDPDDLAKRGVRTLHRITHDELADRAPAASGDALAQLIGHLRPDGVLAVSSDGITEAMAHVAAVTGLPLATNCVEVSTGDPWLLTRVRGGGMLLEESELHVGAADSAASMALLTIAQGVTGDIGAGPVESCEVREFVPDLSETTQARVVERASRGSGMTLATAPVIVSGGRGVGSAEGYRVLEELAERLGGVVGCSRVATNNGWRPHSDQVGLTGTKVTPDLYLACGISGATQHWVGCMDSKVIMAINTDPEAPLVRRATYAVIGDVHEVLPAIIEELNARSKT
ncbi:electron transfer flavoprotein subunit alpha/FixB family protein [Haloechinothrix halophila]|uniref:electron transfer flavoprotein subunit alpha/FixB family protein n=1 Tax=Haloechinothrix halophila TaxID=1069073 RepID=UPI0003FF02CB|nr:electron transfer flavoprotein subunit alpha/FixB family protein [Haloechinothrix halophila]